MKIGIESQRIFRKGKHGMDVVALELIRSLQQIDKKNEYTLFAKKGADNDCITQTENFRTIFVKGYTYADWEQISLPAALRKNKPDLVHCTANTAPLNCPVPLVLTVHDIIYLEETSFRGSAYQNFGNIYRRLIVPPAIKKAKRIIAVSEYEKEIIVEKCAVDPNKISIVYNAVNKRFNPFYSEEEKVKLRKKYNLPGEFILFLGNTAPKKNTAAVIQAYIHYCHNTIDPLPAVITDYRYTDLERILSAMKRLEDINRFIVPGYIPNSEMPLLYNCAALFLYPSLRESFGLPVLEAMACGVAVISSDVSAIPEIAGDAALLVSPEDPVAIGNAILHLLSDKEKKSSNIQKGLVRAGLFNWDNSAKKLLELYSQVI